MEEGYSLNISHPTINKGEVRMDIGSYFNLILIVLTALIFIALVLGFLYLVYGKEDETEEEEK